MQADLGALADETPSFGNRRAQDLCPEKCTLGLLNHLLIHTLWRMVHYHCAGLVVDLRIDSGVSDKVDNPFLTIFF